VEQAVGVAAVRVRHHHPPLAGCRGMIARRGVSRGRRKGRGGGPRPTQTRARGRIAGAIRACETSRRRCCPDRRRSCMSTSASSGR
jgi:hypothetical protein